MTVPRRLPADAVMHRSIEELLERPRLGTGVHSVLHRGRAIDLKFEDRGYDATFVSFHAAVRTSKITLPVFSGAGVTADLPVNTLLVSDPSLAIAPGLNLAWFAGSSWQPRLQEDLARIIAAFVPVTERTVLFGASGGGFAAMYYATTLSGSLAVAINPQTRLSRYNPIVVERYLKLGWHGMDLESTGITHDLVELYRTGPRNSVRYVQNTGDDSHMADHYGPFFDAVPESPRVTSMLLDVGHGHVAPPRDEIAGILAEACSDHLGS